MKRSTTVAMGAIAGAAVVFSILNSQAAPTTKVVQVASKPKALAPLPKGIGGTWKLDPMHSTVGFAIDHMTINIVNGTFNDIEGTVQVNEKDIRKSSVVFSAKTASIDTNVKMRDDHLRSPDFFDVKKYPTLTFKSTRVDRTATGFEATGLFTMKGVTKRIVIPFTAQGPVADPMGDTRAGVKARLTLDRRDYGITYNAVLDRGRLALGNIVKVNLDLEAVKDGPKKDGPKKEAPKKG